MNQSRKPHHLQHCENNKVLRKCKEERNKYIQRQIEGLIKKQLKTFFISKKLQKEVEDHQKDYIVMSVPTPLERVNQFRTKQKERSINLLNNFQEKQNTYEQQTRIRKEESEAQKIMKAKDNLNRIAAVTKNHNLIRKKQNQKLKELKTSHNTTRLESSMSPRRTVPISQDYQIQKRISTAKENNRQMELNQINRYLNKMKTMEERCLKRQLDLQQKKELASKKISQCNIAKRKEIQEDLMNTWGSRYQNTVNKFNLNRQCVILSKTKALFERSSNQFSMRTSVIERKYRQQSQLAKSRIQSMEKKMFQIKAAPKRQNCQVSMSITNFNHNFHNARVDQQKEEHNQIMHRVHEILEKLKTLGPQQKLPITQINQLLSNMNQNDPFYQQIQIYLKNSKDKFYERKQKEEEQKVKKLKKVNQKML